MSTQAAPPPARYKLLGVECNATTIPELLGIFENVIETDQPNFIIGNHNIHSIYLFQREARMRQFYDLRGITYIDSMPLIFLGRMLGLPLERRHRTAFLDWHEQLLSLAEDKGWRIFYVGGKSESIRKADALLRRQYPQLNIRFHHGFFGSEEVEGLYEEIREFRPNILLVGMGMPRQEDWILSASQHVRANAWVNGGAMIEYLVGEQTPCPRWMGQLGFEWLFRLAMQPRRLGRRYLIEPLTLLNLLLKDFGAAWTRASLQGRERQR